MNYVSMWYVHSLNFSLLSSIISSFVRLITVTDWNLPEFLSIEQNLCKIHHFKFRLRRSGSLSRNKKVK